MKKEKEGLWQTHGASVSTESMSDPDMKHTHKCFVQIKAHHTSSSSASARILWYRWEETKWMH